MDYIATKNNAGNYITEKLMIKQKGYNMEFESIMSGMMVHTCNPMLKQKGSMGIQGQVGQQNAISKTNN